MRGVWVYQPHFPAQKTTPNTISLQKRKKKNSPILVGVIPPTIFKTISVRGKKMLSDHFYLLTKRSPRRGTRAAYS